MANSKSGAKATEIQTSTTQNSKKNCHRTAMFRELLRSFHLWISWKGGFIEVGEDKRGRLNTDQVCVWVCVCVCVCVVSWDDTCPSLMAHTAPLSLKCDQINIEGTSWLPSEDYIWGRVLLLAAGSREIRRSLLHFEIWSSDKLTTVKVML